MCMPVSSASSATSKSPLRRCSGAAAMASSLRVLLLVLMLLQGAWLLQAARAPDPIHTTVIIIGAGMSGIKAGQRLAEKGVTDVIILEARDEIGGRIMTHDFNGIIIEKGANWIEGIGGPEVNPIIPIAKKLNLVNTLSPFDNTTYNIFDANGKVSLEVCAATTTRIDDLYAFTASMGTSLTNTNETDINVLTAQSLYTRVPTTPVEMVIDYYINDFEFAEPPRVTSLKSTQPLPTFTNFGVDMNFVHDSRGYKIVVQDVAQSFLKHDNDKITDPRLKLNKVVRKVEYNKKGVRVTTEDGSVYTADYAMLSVSLGVLQSQLIDFVPDLPFWKLKAVYAFDMALYMKIFLKFSSRFWDTNPGMKFWLYADERRGYYPVWENMDSEFPGENILMVTVTDEEARRIEQQPDSETLAEIMAVLRTTFGKNIPAAENIYVCRWWTDRLFRGAFSNWPIGVDSDIFQQLQAPVKTLYFTGEHASELYNGYVHGAYLQGIATANSLLDCKFHGKCAASSSAYAKLSRECSRHLDSERDRQKNSWMKIVAKLEKELAEAKRRN